MGTLLIVDELRAGGFDPGRVDLERQQRELYDREHHIAQMLQSALVPPVTMVDIEGCKAALKYEPALKEAEVGGTSTMSSS